MSVKTFKKEFDSEKNSLLNQASSAVKNTGLYGWNLVTAGTPVLTGRARGSWLLTVDDIDNTTLPPTKGSKRVHPEPSRPKIKFDISKSNWMFITNNVDYIEYLEDGTDKFEPFAMVANAVPKINKELQRRFNNIK